MILILFVHFLNNEIYGKFTVPATVSSSISNFKEKTYMHLMYTSIFNSYKVISK